MGERTMLYSISMRGARYAGRIKASYHKLSDVDHDWAGWGEGKEKKKGKGFLAPAWFVFTDVIILFHLIRWQFVLSTLRVSLI